MNPLKDVLPPRARFWVYVAYGIVGVLIGAIQVGVAAAEQDQPMWLTVALAVYAFLGGPLGATASGNVTYEPRHRLDTAPDQ